MAVEHALVVYFCEASELSSSMSELDPFQQMGIPCWQQPAFLDDPNEPPDPRHTPWAEWD